ncbi:c5.1 [Tranosema rostrale ichnovirus]|nr:c5.1 [Tranosema rostrale ichnovirus]
MKQNKAHVSNKTGHSLLAGMCKITSSKLESRRKSILVLTTYIEKVGGVRVVVPEELLIFMLKPGTLYIELVMTYGLNMELKWVDAISFSPLSTIWNYCVNIRCQPQRRIIANILKWLSFHVPIYLISSMFSSSLNIIHLIASVT